MDEKDHGELGMNDRLLNIYDIQTLLKEQLGNFRDNSNLILSNHGNDKKVFLLQKRRKWHL